MRLLNMTATILILCVLGGVLLVWSYFMYSLGYVAGPETDWAELYGQKFPDLPPGYNRVIFINSGAKDIDRLRLRIDDFSTDIGNIAGNRGKAQCDVPFDIGGGRRIVEIEIDYGDGRPIVHQFNFSRPEGMVVLQVSIKADGEISF